MPGPGRQPCGAHARTGVPLLLQSPLKAPREQQESGWPRVSDLHLIADTPTGTPGAALGPPSAQTGPVTTLLQCEARAGRDSGRVQQAPQGEGGLWASPGSLLCPTLSVASQSPPG